MTDIEVVEVSAPEAPEVVVVEVPGAQGAPGDQNVLILDPGEDVPPATRDRTIVYRLAEAP